MQKVVIAVVLALGAAVVQAQPAAMLVYKVWEPGSGPYFSRMLITPGHVRLDEGRSGQGYTLFDRRERIIYNVSDEEQSILVMDPPSLDPTARADLLLSETHEPDVQAPPIAGRQPIQVRLLANGEVCAEMVVVEGLMTGALDGLREFRQVLAQVQAATLGSRPAQLQTPCDLASNVYAPTRGLDFGLPIQERGAGRSQSLVDFNPLSEFDPQLFTLPERYDQVPMATLLPM